MQRHLLAFYKVAKLRDNAPLNQPVTTLVSITNNLHLLCQSFFCGRQDGLMVSVLDPGASSPGSSPGWGHCVVFWARHFTLTVPLSTQVYRWVPVNCWGNLKKLRGSDLRWTSIPSRRSRNTSSHFMLQKPG